jgi:hypothetical protein
LIYQSLVFNGRIAYTISDALEQIASLVITQSRHIILKEYLRTMKNVENDKRAYFKLKMIEVFKVSSPHRDLALIGFKYLPLFYPQLTSRVKL